MPERVILVVEDDPNVLLVQRAMRKAGIRHRVELVRDGDAAVSYLAGIAPFDRAQYPLPAVVLLDLKLPRRSGHEVLEWMRVQPGIRRIPVIVLTASAESDDVRRAYDLGASSYLVKPSELDGLRAIVEIVERYWLVHNLVPDATAPVSTAARGAGLTRIAVIDDSPEDRALAIRELRRAFPEAEVIEVASREEFDRLLDEDLAVVVTDYELRWSNGLAVAQDIRARVPDAIIIMFTGSGSEQVAVEALHAGVDDYVLKSPKHYVRLAPALSAAASRLTQRRAVAEAQAERDRALERERILRVQAEEANRIKEEFLATLSHELRTPLNAILGWARIVEGRAQDSAAVERGLGVIVRNARAQARLVEDLLDMSAISAGKLQLTLSNDLVDLRELVRAAVELARPDAEVKQLTLEIEQPSEELAARADPHRVQQILWNLLSNAIRFTPEGGSIVVRTHRESAQMALIEIADSGVGIDAAFLPRVFDRFRQADQSTTRAYGGLGLGLSIARDLVRMHGGSLEIRSEGQGKGTTTALRLPLAAGSKTAREAEASPRGSRLSGAKVLVVEDHHDTAELLSMTLGMAGAVVELATSAEEALTRLDRGLIPELIISDIAMPGRIDGLELMRSIRRRPGRERWVPSIALTALARAQEVEAALAAGFNRHLTKPAPPDVVIEAAHALLEAHR